MSYSTSKNKISSIFYNSEEVKNNQNRLIVNNKQLKKQLRNIPIYNIIKTIQKFETKWMALEDINTTPGNYLNYSKEFEVNLNDFPLFLLPFLQVSFIYRHSDSEKIDLLLYNFDTIYRILDLEDDENFFNVVKPIKIKVRILFWNMGDTSDFYVVESKMKLSFSNMLYFR